MPEDSQKIGFFRFPLTREKKDCHSGTEVPKKACSDAPDAPASKMENPQNSRDAKNVKDCSLNSIGQIEKCLVVPYEWYKTDPILTLSSEKEDGEHKAKEDGNGQEKGENQTDVGNLVLVLWIMDEVLDHETPLRDLHSLVYALKQNIPNDKLKFKIIGPRTTTTLKNMVKELESNSTEKDAEKSQSTALADVPFFSPWSTSPEWLLLKPEPEPEPDAQMSIGSLFMKIESLFMKYDKDEEDKPDKPDKESIQDKKNTFIRTIGTDDQLVEALIQELCRRGMEVGREDVPITLVSEWDTAYGRALPLTFAAIVAQMKEDRFHASDFTDLKMFINKLQEAADPLSQYLKEQFSKTTRDLVDTYNDSESPSEQIETALLGELNKLLRGPSLYHEQRFAKEELGKRTRKLIEKLKEKEEKEKKEKEKKEIIAYLNKLFLEDAYPEEINFSICRHEKFQDRNSKTHSDLRRKVQALKRKPENLANLGIKQYAYLRGLDGELPQEFSSKTSNSSQGSNNSKGLWGKKQEVSSDIKRPEGATQIDYVRRLTSRIEGEMGEGGTPVKAIGVLGSDVYDKLLILQALRPRFPNAIFFTTDLDARFLHPSQKDWTRNLLVASHYGLALHKNLQGMVAPFRDGYQTAVFRSVLQALCSPTDNSLCGFPQVGYGEKEIRLFELGMTMPVDLSESDGSHVHPDPIPPSSLYWEKSFHPLILLSCLLLALMLIGRFVIAGFLDDRTWWAMAVYCVVIGLVLWFSWDLSKSRELLYWTGEPFYWFEGVSIWPSQLLRVTAAFLCVCFLLKIYGEFHDRETPKSAKSSGGSEDTSWTVWKATYEERYPRWKRVVVYSVIYVVFAILLWTLIGQPENDVLYRGQVEDSSFTRNTVVKGPLLIAVLLLIGLIWQVIERTLECCHFVRNSGKKYQVWPVEKSFIVEVANRTEKVGQIIYYPVIALIVLAASRFSLFDNWDFPLALILIIGINFSLMLCCAVVLRVSAEKARKEILESLEDKLFQFTVEGNDSKFASKLRSHKFVIDEIQRLKHGAFAPLSQHPIFGAILYPFGGVGLLVLIEHFIT
ncbi:MAG: hypothetical protein OEM58_03915 [Nitrospirota bacterium]|nr:hypothetical protein [Nitrospirota bacterium]